MARWLFVPSRLALLAAVGLAVGGAACSSAESPAVANTAPAAIDIGRENVVTVQTAEITVGPLISGDLRAQLEATVRAELGGSVLQVVPDEGQVVKRGALLARIEARTQEDALRSAQSMVRSAEESLSVAERELVRTERLVTGGALAERELEAARNAAVLARAQRDDAQSRLASASKALADGTVRAPIAGTVARRHVNRGDVVSPGDELYTIIDPSSMRLEASVPSEQLSAITIDATVNFQVRGYPGQTFAGQDRAHQPNGRSRDAPGAHLRDDPQRGKAGSWRACLPRGASCRKASARWSCRSRPINERSGAPWVLRVRDGKTEKVAVTLGLRDAQTERVEIAAGVSEGDVLLVGASQGMTPGTPVKVRSGGAGRRRGLTCSFLIFHSASDHHRRQHAGAGDVRHLRARPAEDRRVPRCLAAHRVGGLAVSGRLARHRGARGHRPDRRADVGDQRRQEDSEQRARQLRRDHRRVHLRQGPAGGHAGHS